MNDFHNSRKPNCSGCIVFFKRSSTLRRALLTHGGNVHFCLTVCAQLRFYSLPDDT